MGVPSWSQTAADNDDSDSDINWAEGQAPSTVNNSARQMMAAIAEQRDDQGGKLTTAGSSNAYTVTTNSTYTSYANGMCIKAKANHSNTGAATINVDSLGSKKIRKFTSAGEGALSANDIVSGSYYEFVYNSALDATAGGFEVKPTQSVGIDINGTTELTTPAVADEALVYDASATANRKITLANLLKVISELTAETSVAADDTLVINDTSDSNAANKITVQGLYNAINVLTAETAPATDDVIPIYDASGTAADKITLSDLLKVINSLTEDTTPDITTDFVATYDASTSGVKKAKVSSFCASAEEIWAGDTTKPINVANWVSALEEQPLTFGSTVTPDGDDGINFVCTATSDFTLANFANKVIGYPYQIRFVHTEAGNAITSWGTDYEAINGTLPVLSTVDNDEDVLFIKYLTSSRALVWLARDIG